MNFMVNLRHKWYNWRQYRNNIKIYKQFLKEDALWDNDSIFTFLMLKLDKTAEYYRSGLHMPYEHWEIDQQLIERALHLAEYMHEVSQGTLAATVAEAQDATIELFDILKDCRNWWD